MINSTNQEDDQFATVFYLCIKASKQKSGSFQRVKIFVEVSA